VEESEFFIYGDGDHAREIQHGLEHGYMLCLLAFGNWTSYLIGENQKFPPRNPERVFHVIGIGQPKIRRKVAQLIGDEVSWKSIANKESAFFNEYDFEAGWVFMANSTIACGTQIGKHVLVNYNASVGHDAIVGDYTVISPNSSIGGRCELGEAVYIGAGANVRERVKIGDEAFVGLGATVTKDVPPNTIVIGVNEHYTREEWEARKNGSS